MADNDTFDCFLSHNSRDKPAVRALVAAMRARGLRIWMDEEQLRPGIPWQPLLESGIRVSRSVAVLVGADGLGPWEEEEMHGALTLAVKDKRPVIPVLLPDAPAVPDLPYFLANRTWVDLRPGADAGGLPGLDRLVWGITGRRPEGGLSLAQAIAAAPPRRRRRARWMQVAALSIAVIALGTTWVLVRVPASSPAVAEPPAPAAAVGSPEHPARGTWAPWSDTMKDGGRGPEMISLPGGCFQMGSPPNEPEREKEEGPQHSVCLDAFAMGRTEVTFAQYDRFAEATGGKKPDDNSWGRGERPVINVTWQDAQHYTRWLSEQTGQDYRLPTEAEWEYAARAGTQTPFWTGNCVGTDQANYNGRSDYAGCPGKKGIARVQTVPAASLPANPWGLHEVAGNVWEWVQDCWHPDDAGTPSNGGAWLESGAGDCERRVIRGGYWNSSPRMLRSAYRLWGTRDDTAHNGLGFRLARTWSSQNSDISGR